MIETAIFVSFTLSNNFHAKKSYYLAQLGQT